MDKDTLLEVNDLKTHFHLKEGVVKAVDGATFKVKPGQTIGVVGESGCGKSMTARTILRIEPKGAEVSGEVLFNRNAGISVDAVDMVKLDRYGDEIRSIRGADIAMIFQEPMSSLSPVHTIGSQIREAIILHQDVDKDEAKKLTLESLEIVGMPRAGRIMKRYPHQLSGGMRQRAMIAMGLACRPKLLIADEPTTALDVTTQAQILKLMRDLQAEFGMAILFITHDLGVIAQMTEYMVVMYMGKVVEAGPVTELFSNPQHPYTRALLNSVPLLDKQLDRLAVISGSVPDPFHLPTGCPFHPRCPHAIKGVCDVDDPPVVQITDLHRARCVLPQMEMADTV